MPQRKAISVLIVAAAISAAGQTRSPGVYDLDKDREAVVALDGTWRFHTGDDLHWADPAFDDSRWPVLKVEPGGWGSQGYPGYSGYAWYRAKLLLPAGAPPQDLSITVEAIHTDYQVFADGALVEACSPPSITVAGNRRNEICPLTNSTTLRERSVLLAIRVWQWPYWASYTSGGIIKPLRVGSAKQLQVYAENTIFRRIWLVAMKNDMLAIIYGLAALWALCFYVLRHREKEYLWLGVYGVLYCAGTCYETYVWFHEFRYLTKDAILETIGVAQGFVSIAFYRSLLNARRNWLYWCAVAGVAATFVVIMCENESTSVALINELHQIFALPILFWIAYLLICRAVEGYPDARLLLAPAILGPLIQLTHDLYWTLHVAGWGGATPDWLTVTFQWPFPFNLVDLADFIFINALVAILLLRFNRASTQGERLNAEVEAARATQRVLVPEEIAPVEGYAIESAYRPASRLSGDFFQVLPTKTGETLVALGDVSGKGLAAAMAGTLAIGSMRTLASAGLRPASLMYELNEQVLAGKQGGFITLICASIALDGTVTLANAGHLNPYRNGEEMEVAHGFPLGIVAGTSYEETVLRLAPGDRLMFLSDGVVEARSATGELFGFERTEEISARPPEEIALEAQRFGQDDDITVLTLTRTG